MRSSSPELSPRRYSGQRHAPLRVKEPGKYNGKSDVKDFLSQFEILSRYNGWEEDEMGHELACVLDGEAREILRIVPHREQCNYAALKRALYQRYAPPGRASRFAVELWQRTMKTQENAVEFGNALKRLARQAYPRSGLDDEVLIGCFVRGLRDRDTKRHVQLAKPQNLDEAISLATECEVFDETTGPGTITESRGRKPKGEFIGKVKDEGKIPNQTTPNTALNFPTTPQPVAPLGQNTRQPPTSGGSDPQFPPQVPSNRAGNSAPVALPLSDNPQASQNYARRPLQCFYCNEFGHIARLCPLRRVHEKQRAGANAEAQGTYMTAEGTRLPLN